MRTRLKRWLFEGEVLRLMGFTMIVKPIGLVTQMLTASYFGAGVGYDAYAFAFFLVSFLDNLVGQSYNSVVVPLTIRLRNELDKRDLLRFQNALLGIFMVPVVVYMAILFLRSDWIVGVIGPNLPAETRGYVDRMLKWMALPGVALMAISMGNAVLNANRRFRMAGAMPIINAAVFLAVIVALHGRLGIWALPAAFLASNVVQLAAIGGFAFSTGCVAPVRPAIPPGRIGQLWSLGSVFVLSQVILTAGMSIDKFFATGLEKGSVSAIAYAGTILNMGGSIFSASLVVVMFTRMSEYLAAGRIESCSAYIHDNLNRQVRTLVPISLALCLASDEIVRVLFARGAFDSHAAAVTSSALAVFMLGLPAMIFNTTVARIYHALQRMRDRVWLNAQYVLTALLGNILLVGSLKVVGLAWSATLAINLHMALSLWVLHRYRTGLRIGSFSAVVLRGYALGGLTYLLYWASGFGRLLDAWPHRWTTPGSIATAFARFAFVMIVYFAGYFAWRARDRRRARSAASAAASAPSTEA